MSDETTTSENESNGVSTTPVVLEQVKEEKFSVTLKRQTLEAIKNGRTTFTAICGAVIDTEVHSLSSYGLDHRRRQVDRALQSLRKEGVIIFRDRHWRIVKP